MNDENLNRQLQQLGMMAKAQALAQQQTLAVPSQPDIDFTQMMQDVKPLKPRNQYQHPRDTSPIRRRQVAAETLMDEDCFFVGSDASLVAPARFSKNGRGIDDVRRLQTKYWPIVAYVDLHGYNQVEAQQVLSEFIDYVQQRGVVGEIIHGSGLGSRDYEPVLKNLVRRWLMAHPQVIAYAQPHEHNDGAVYVLVKKRRSHHD